MLLSFHVSSTTLYQQFEPSITDPPFIIADNHGVVDCGYYVIFSLDSASDEQYGQVIHVMPSIPLSTHTVKVNILKRIEEYGLFINILTDMPPRS